MAAFPCKDIYKNVDPSELDVGVLMSYSVNKSAIKKLQRQRSINSEVTLSVRPTSKTYNNKSTEIANGIDRLIFESKLDYEGRKAFTRKMGKGLKSLPNWMDVSVNL